MVQTTEHFMVGRLRYLDLTLNGTKPEPTDKTCNHQNSSANILKIFNKQHNLI